MVFQLGANVQVDCGSPIGILSTQIRLNSVFEKSYSPLLHVSSPVRRRAEVVKYLFISRKNHTEASRICVVMMQLFIHGYVALFLAPAK